MIISSMKKSFTFRKEIKISLRKAVSSVSKYLCSRNSQMQLYMYGSDDRLLLGYGNNKEFRIKGNQCSTNTIKLLNEFLEENSKSFSFGYISFDFHYSDKVNDQPIINFVVPALTIEITAEGGIQQVNGQDTEGIISFLSEILYRDYDQEVEKSCFLNPSEYDLSYIKHFTQKIEIVKSLIDNGNVSRLTLARKIQLPSSISLIESFLFRKSLKIKNDKSYFWQDEYIQFVGNNPELLAVGNKYYFETFKLSGTSPCSIEPRNDKLLKHIFINDKKNIDEHESSIRSMAESLKTIGRVTRHSRCILDWYNLRHMMTKFSITTTPSISIANILMTILPTGCDPKVKGLEIIKSLESESRGPYYGIIGVVEPNGNFAFSQNIRTIFRSENQNYLWVGAAITKASDAMSEYEETQIKAQNTVCSTSFKIDDARQSIYKITI